MSNQVAIVQELFQLEGKFSKQNAYDLKFESECLFAKQQILKNDYVFSVASQSPESLKNAILNVAAIGISLNPASAHAYLVPRDKAICLDISYRGLVKLATDSGAIHWAKAVLVYEGDTFKWRGPAKAPKHEADVFDTDRINADAPLENLKGGYCLAELSDGSVMVEVMTRDEIIAVRDSSMAYTRGKRDKGPWDGKWAGEMAKKTLVKRASKSWPQSSGRERLDKAVEVLNQHEGLRQEEPVDPQAIEDYKRILATGSPAEFFLFEQGLSETQKNACFNAASYGEKGKFKQEVRDKTQAAIVARDNAIGEMLVLISTDDPAALEIVDELDEHEHRMVMDKLTDLDKRRLQSIRESLEAMA